MRNAFQLAIALALFAFGGGLAPGGPPESKDVAKVPFHAQGEKSGDPTQTSIILLTRLTAVEKGEIEQDVPGMDGRAHFEVSETPGFKASRMTPWVEATKDNDHTIKQTVTKLKSGRDYWYRVHITDVSGKGKRVGPARSFKTAPSADEQRNVRFAVITGQGYATRDNDRGHVTYHGIDKLGIDFIALTGDTVYYDGPAGGIPKSLWPPGIESSREVHRAVRKLLNEMTDDNAVLWLRKHWHAMYALPIQREFFGKYAGYWEMDDHDYRSDDWSTHYKPGLLVFREQNPVPERTYRTVR
ncbi:MAG: PhoD-like phosphatase N-terminal domain-containing protein, partial [Pirellulaceae bacterium]|nr:PhoD-like phosphatase N-terminal domain-containing protein [Pirellulaceae bacterium]